MQAVKKPSSSIEKKLEEIRKIQKRDDYLILYSRNPNVPEEQYNNRVELIFEKNDGYKHIGRSNSFTQIMEIRDYVHSKNGPKDSKYYFGIKLKYRNNDENEYPDSNMSFKLLKQLIEKSNFEVAPIEIIKKSKFVNQSEIDLYINPLNSEKFSIRLEQYTTGEKIPEIYLTMEGPDKPFFIKIHMALWKSSDYNLTETAFKDLKESFYRMKAAFSQFETERVNKETDADTDWKNFNKEFEEALDNCHGELNKKFKVKY